MAEVLLLPLVLQCSHGCWVLSPQISVSYYEPDEEVPMATAELYLTGIGECCSHHWMRGGLGRKPEEGALSVLRCLPSVLSGFSQRTHSRLSSATSPPPSPTADVSL